MDEEEVDEEEVDVLRWTSGRWQVAGGRWQVAIALLPFSLLLSGKNVNKQNCLE